MGDMADYYTDIGSELWFDHICGHPNIPDPCPYCEQEYHDLIDEATLMTESEDEGRCQNEMS